MKKIELEIAVGGQKADAFLFRQGEARRPGVLLYPDIRGPRDVYQEQAERIADQGYTVLLPNVFFRGGRMPLFPFPFVFGEERTMKRLHELFAALTPQMQLADGGAYVDFLSADEGVSDGPMGVVGYCFTGAMAMRTAAARPDRIRAAASFHGGRLFTDQPDSPHHLLPRIKAALYFAHAVEDQTMPADAIAKLGEALRSWGGKFSSVTYEGARHGWTHTDSPVYNREQADRAFGELLQLLRSNLHD